MGERPDRPDEVRDYDPSTARSEGGHGTTGSGAPESGQAGSSSGEVERTQAEIERTRSDMSETVDAIQHKVSPQNIKEQAKEQAKGTAKSTGSTIVETVKQNPMPAALTGIGLGWLFMSARKRGSGQSRSQGGEPYAYQYPPTYSPPRYEERGAGGSATDQAQEGAGQVASRAQHQASRVGDETQQQAQRAKGTFERMLHENPLAVGALALGAGATVGLAIPETGKEHEVMGETRDRVVEKAQQKAQEVKPKVDRVAEEAQSAAKEGAKDQGLTQQ